MEKEIGMKKNKQFLNNPTKLSEINSGQRNSHIRSYKFRSENIYIVQQLSALILALIYLTLPHEVTTNCGEILADTTTAFGSILDMRVASNGTLQTVDYHAIYRVLDLNTKNVIYSYDMKPDLSSVNSDGINSLDPEEVKFI